MKRTIYIAKQTSINQRVNQNLCSECLPAGAASAHPHSGMLACFFQGLDWDLLASISRSRQMRVRVLEGWMMSSTNPAKDENKKTLNLTNHEVFASQPSVSRLTHKLA